MLKQTGLSEEELDRVKLVIKEFLVQSQRDELFETRIQKLIFYGEVYCVVHYSRRMTKAEYRPYMYGAFSRDVRYALNVMDDITEKNRIVNNNRTTAYSLDSKDNFVSDGLQRIISAICDKVNRESTEELAQFSKDSWLFEETEYDQPMDFEEFDRAITQNDGIKNKLERQLPEKIDGVESELYTIS
ncbi:type II toxin-antitoxin system antitoxin SocA domain-containing protein [Haloarchaeobius iranensis]|uniref:Antitoxin SocA-like Panacea domain-containing protein n=1 Tax=Haloarchaeobius iranensis TaxID=996166 RepID=A0A1G9YEW2_9EURY|nr:type II toxin-antitoxin system antitoxin SocA domain-containing protein [Haloarchaeobius iranensis]SDN07116.1 Protein of unknown function [Haloarchaeobius iranensis]